MSNLLLLLLMIAVIAYWVRAVYTYDWSKFEEDSANDDFLKPINGPDNKP